VARSRPDELCDFSGDRVPQIGRKATTPTKASRGPTSRAVDAEGGRPGRVRSLPPPIPPGWASGILGRKRTPLGSYPSVHPWSSGRAARSVRGLDGVLGVPTLDRFARRRNTIVSTFIGFSEDLFRLRRRIVAPCLPLLRQERFGSAPHSLGVRFVTHAHWCTRLRPMRSDPRGRETPTRFSARRGAPWTAPPPQGKRGV
jgi:hypothetical protein